MREMSEQTEARIRADYSKHDAHRQCHMCDKLRTIDELIADLKAETAVIQTWTGRIMCYPKCWADYRKSEGFD